MHVFPSVSERENSRFSRVILFLIIENKISAIWYNPIIGKICYYKLVSQYVLSAISVRPYNIIDFLINEVGSSLLRKGYGRKD